MRFCVHWSFTSSSVRYAFVIGRCCFLFYFFFRIIRLHIDHRVLCVHWLSAKRCVYTIFFFSFSFVVVFFFFLLSLFFILIRTLRHSWLILSTYKSHHTYLLKSNQLYDCCDCAKLAAFYFVLLLLFRFVVVLFGRSSCELVNSINCLLHIQSNQKPNQTKTKTENTKQKKERQSRKRRSSKELQIKDKTNKQN